MRRREFHVLNVAEFIGITEETVLDENVIPRARGLN